MSLDLTTFDAALKEHYTDDAVMNEVYRDNPLLAMLPKMEDFGGRNLPIPLIYGNPQGRSATFANAQARGLATSSLIEQFTLTRVKDYSLANIDNETLEASKGNANAFMEAATTEIDGAINSLSRSIAVKMYGDGFGAIGQVSAPGASTTLTLTNSSQITNFEVGMAIVFSASAGANTLRAGGAALFVTGVNRTEGTMTVNANVNSIAGITTSDFIFVQGDRQDSATPSRLCLSGLEAWIPATAPGATAFFGVDRSVDTTRLGGQRLVGTGTPIEEVLVDGAAQVGREGGKLTDYFMNYATYASLEKSLGSKVMYVDLKVNAEIAFRGIMINGPRGPINCIPDQNCPSNRIFGLSLPMWKLYSLGKAVRVIDTDGLQMLRQASADGVEVRYGFYGNMGCKAPAYNINIQI